MRNYETKGKEHPYQLQVPSAPLPEEEERSEHAVDGVSMNGWNQEMKKGEANFVNGLQT